MKDRICIVAARYGLEVNGGAELLARLLAERLKEHIGRIDVLTSCAIDYMSWKNEYPAGDSRLHGIYVHRFPVTHERDPKAYDAINKRFLHGQLPAEEEAAWFESQGPAVPGLVDYIRRNHDRYDAFLFIGYLYYPVVMGLPEASDRAIFLPLAHNEPFLRMETYKRLFTMPRYFFFNTEEERDLVQFRFDNEHIPCEIGGVGIDLPEHSDPDAFRQKYDIRDPFLLYIGRIDDHGKNCGMMFRYFQEYKKRTSVPLKLVLMGRPSMVIPEDPDILSLGFVEEQDKFDGLAAATVLLQPSQYESLSITALEAMGMGTPILVNGASSVLKAHCLKSNAGLYFLDYLGFEAALNYLLSHPNTVAQMKRFGEDYVRNTCSWEDIIAKLTGIIRTVADMNAEGPSD